MDCYLLGLEKSDHHIFMHQFDFSEKIGLCINVENTKGFGERANISIQKLNIWFIDL